MTKKIICPHCGSEHTNKAGFTHNKKQRYYCRDCRRFSRENAVVNSTLNPRKRSSAQKSPLPSRNHLILKLRSLAQKLGRTPSTADINASAKRGGIPLYVFYEVFGSYETALESSLLPLRYKQHFDREALLEELRALRKKLKRALIAEDVHQARLERSISSPYHFQRAFGSIPRAIAAAGVGRCEISRAEIISYLRKLGEQLNRPPTGKDIAQRFVPGETPSLKEILRTFGTLTEAKKRAGVEN